jgi:chorismate--pyruvate lyase
MQRFKTALTTKSTLYPQEPLWFCKQLHSRLNIPASSASWINELGSITQRLRSQYGARIHVKVLKQHWQRAFISENRLLKIPPAKYVLNREVLLYADDTPLVLARTIIPRSTLASAQQNLSHLGSRPLGEVIFAYPKLKRLALEVTQIKPQDWSLEIQKKAMIKEHLWGRRTIYLLHRHPLLVSEFFLNDLLK